MSIEIKKRIGLGQTIFKFELSNKFISTINNKVDDDLKLGQAIDASDSLSAKIIREYHILHQPYLLLPDNNHFFLFSSQALVTPILGLYPL